MKIKTAELEGVQLDWAVAKAEGELDTEIDVGSRRSKAMVLDGPHGVVSMRTGNYFRPTTTWAQGGPIIERERIELTNWAMDGWQAKATDYSHRADEVFATCNGPTPLIAAMRCYVASKLGDEIEVP